MRQVFGADKVDKKARAVNQNTVAELVDEEEEIVLLDAEEAGNDQLDVIFEEQLSSYRLSLLPKKDLWVCPICYTHLHRLAQRRFLPKKKEAEEGNDVTDLTRSDSDASLASEDHLKDDDNCDDLLVDPLVVLGMACIDVWRRRSSFRGKREDEDEVDNKHCSYCVFEYKTELLAHLEDIHFPDTKPFVRKRDLVEFYCKFKLRAPDGLLQKFWSHKAKGKLGMQHYWSEPERVCFYVELFKRMRGEEGAPTEKPPLLEKSLDTWKKIAPMFEDDDSEAEAFIVSDADESRGASGFLYDHLKLHSKDRVNEEAEIKRLKDLAEAYEAEETELKDLNQELSDTSSVSQDSISSSSLSSIETKKARNPPVKRRIARKISQSSEESVTL